MSATSVQSQTVVGDVPHTASGAFAQYWRVALLATTVLILFRDVLIVLVGDWLRDPDYSHGFFVPLFSGYLIWSRRESLKNIVARPSYWGVVVVLFSLALLFLGSLGAEVFLTRVGFVGTVVGLLLFFRGAATVRALAFPLGFLLLMIPLPAIIYNEIVFPLQLIASRFAGSCLQQMHSFPVLREGNLLILPNYTLEVVEACSGIRSLMSLIALALAYGYLAESNRWVRSLLVLLVFPVAVISNGFRVMLAAIVTYHFGPEIGEGILHSMYGIVVFLFGVLLIILAHVAIKRFGNMWHSPRRENA